MRLDWWSADEIIAFSVDCQFLGGGFQGKNAALSSLQDLLFVSFVDYTSVIYPCGSEGLEVFLDHVNSVHRNIIFTMEMEIEDHHTALDIQHLQESQWLAGPQGLPETPCNLTWPYTTTLQQAQDPVLCTQCLGAFMDELEFLRAIFRESAYN